MILLSAVAPFCEVTTNTEPVTREPKLLQRCRVGLLQTMARTFSTSPHGAVSYVCFCLKTLTDVADSLASNSGQRFPRLRPFTFSPQGTSQPPCLLSTLGGAVRRAHFKWHSHHQNLASDVRNVAPGGPEGQVDSVRGTRGAPLPCPRLGVPVRVASPPCSEWTGSERQGLTPDRNMFL